MQAGDPPTLETDELQEEEETKLSLYNIEISKQTLLKKKQVKEQKQRKEIEAKILEEREAAALKEKQDSIKNRITMEDHEESNFQVQTKEVLAGLTPTTPGDESIMNVLKHYQSKDLFKLKLK